MDATTASGHVERIAEVGYTIVEDAIEPDLLDALVDDLGSDHLERLAAEPPLLVHELDETHVSLRSRNQ